MLVLFLLLAVADGALLDDSFHVRLHRENGAAQATGLDEDGLARVTAAINAYLRGARDDLILTETVYGESQTVFNDRERMHMEDVKALFVKGRRVEMGALIAGILLTALGLAIIRRRRGLVAILCKSLGVAAACWLGLCALAAIACIADFNAVFLAFHGLLFDNDLWLMNPETDLMIRLLPERFFVACGARVAVIWGALLAGLTALGFGASKIAGRRAR